MSPSTYSWNAQNITQQHSPTLRRQPLVSLRSGIWPSSGKIPYWWRVTSLILILLLIGCAVRATSYNQYKALSWSGKFHVISMEFLRFVPQTSFWRETSGCVAKCGLFSQASKVPLYSQTSFWRETSGCVAKCGLFSQASKVPLYRMRCLLRRPLGTWRAQFLSLIPVVIFDFRLTEKGYNNLRFSSLLLFCVLRLSLVWRHLQSYLDMAHERIEKMKKETGRISNVDLQRKVINPFSFISFYFSSANMCLFDLKWNFCLWYIWSW